MNKEQKLIERLKGKNLLDSETAKVLGKRLREKLESEAEKQENELIELKKEVAIIKTIMSS